MEKCTIKVQGMYCVGCESRIQNRINAIPGIQSCVADFKKEEVYVTFDEQKVNQEIIEKNIEETGYEVVHGAQANIQTISILIILLALYLIVNHLGFLSVFNIFPVIEETMSYGMVFVIGLLTSVHCIAMCGGINITQGTIASKKKAHLGKSNFLYNLGRVISYTLIGGIVGALGSVITFNGRMKGFVAILAGIVMLIMSFNMLGVFKVFRKFDFHIPKKIYGIGGKFIRKNSSFWIGFFNGLMPCGPLQSMQIYALSTGSFFKGALSMFLFSLGTVPMMMGFGMFFSQLNKKYAKYMLTVSAIIIFVMGLTMMGNGLSLSGIGISVNSESNENIAEINGMEQIIQTEIDYGSYQAITVKKNIPVKWTVYVPEGKLNGCNGEIIIPSYDIDVKLSEGENIIEFTPKESGTIPYSCWMGMIKSNIIVLD